MTLMGMFVGLNVLIAAVSLGAVEKALGRGNERFPCVTDELIWAMRIYAAILFYRGAMILRYDYLGTLPLPTSDQMLGAAGIAAFHLLLFVQILRQRLPAGTWRRLQSRYEKTRRAARVPGAGPVLARSVADMDGPRNSLQSITTAFPEAMHDVLRRLAR